MIMETPFFQAPNLFTWGLKAVLSYATCLLELNKKNSAKP